MFDYATFITILFQFINFGVLITIFGYGIKNYIIPLMKKKIADRRQMLHDLEKQNRSLKGKEQSLKHEIQEQEDLCRRMQENIMQWRLVVERDKKTQQQIWEEQQRHIGESIRVRQEKLAAYRLQQQILKKALKGAEIKLQEQFESEKNGKQFLDDIMDHVRRELV